MKTVKASLSISGVIWQLKGKPEVLKDELAPWQENGEQWRPLKVMVPDSIASHSREQVAYFGPDGLLRRHEYIVDVMGGASGLNYAADCRNVDGIMVSTKPTVYAPDGNKQKIPNPVLVGIDIRDIAFSARSDVGKTIARRP